MRAGWCRRQSHPPQLREPHQSETASELASATTAVTKTFHGDISPTVILDASFGFGVAGRDGTGRDKDGTRTGQGRDGTDE